MNYRSAGLGVVVLVALLSAAFGDYTENWNSSGDANHNWAYWSSNEVAIPWMSSGGYNDSGYVQANLTSMTNWCADNSYWVGYLITNTMAPEQHVDLTGKWIEIRANDMNTADLDGGELYFFIGDWSGPANYSFFYNTNSLTLGANSWDVLHSIAIGENDNWGTIAQVGNTQTPDDLFNNPQQYGFVIYNADGNNGKPSGQLGLDNFAVVPEPFSASLLGAGLLAFRLLRRRAAR